MPILEIKDLSYAYGKGTAFSSDALNGVSFTLENNEILGIIGRTGSGKSTLAQHLNGLIPADPGHIFLAGKDIWENTKEIKSVRFKVGLVFQYPEYQLFEETVEKDIAFGPKNMGLGDDEIARRVMSAAELVGIPKTLLKKSPFDLSGGEKRRVAIAGIIAMEPSVLVLDEPTAGLDPAGREQVLRFIKNYRDKTGASIIFISHSMYDIARTADKILCLNGGKVFAFGTVDDVFREAESLTEIGLDIPDITKIFIALKNRGVSVPENVYTVEQAVPILLEVLGGGVRA